MGNNGKPTEIKVAHLKVAQNGTCRVDGLKFEASGKTFATTAGDGFVALSGVYYAFFEKLACMAGLPGKPENAVIMSVRDFQELLTAVEEGGRIHVEEVSSYPIRMPFTSGPDPRDGERVTYKPK